MIDLSSIFLTILGVFLALLVLIIGVAGVYSLIYIFQAWFYLARGNRDD